ncbi:MAG TPA: hypothetical protein PK395_04955 [bacterium]|nr:hypothetical protein [bacterium]HQP98720.1 hypothetical protein [bacterium]
MDRSTIKASKQEVRIPISDCPWCGRERVALRDYLCYHMMEVCCHELFRAFQGKASLALRQFQGNKIQTEEEWKEYILTFVDLVTKDERQIRKYQPLLEKIHAYQEQFGGEYSDFFDFLIRLYAARGILQMVGDYAEAATRQCLICAASLPEESRSEICIKCQATVGQPEGAEPKASPSTPTAEPTKRIGMATADRRR